MGIIVHADPAGTVTVDATPLSGSFPAQYTAASQGQQLSLPGELVVYFADVNIFDTLPGDALLDFDISALSAPLADWARAIAAIPIPSLASVTAELPDKLQVHFHFFLRYCACVVSSLLCGYQNKGRSVKIDRASRPR